MAPQQSPKFRTAFFGQFFTSLRKDSELATPIMHRFERCFRLLSEDQMYSATRWTFRSSVGKWRHKIRKTAVEIFQNVNNRTPGLCLILHTVIIEVVINSDHVAQHLCITSCLPLPSRWCFWCLVLSSRTLLRCVSKKTRKTAYLESMFGIWWILWSLFGHQWYLIDTTILPSLSGHTE